MSGLRRSWKVGTDPGVDVTYLSVKLSLHSGLNTSAFTSRQQYLSPPSQ